MKVGTTFLLFFSLSFDPLVQASRQHVTRFGMSVYIWCNFVAQHVNNRCMIVSSKQMTKLNRIVYAHMPTSAVKNPLQEFER